MLIAGASAIRDVILFPAMRPEAGPSAAKAVPAPRGIPAHLRPRLRRRSSRRQRPPSRPPRASEPRSRSPGLTRIAGLLFIFSSALDGERRLGLGRLVHDFDGRVAGRVATVLVGAVLLLLGAQLRRGKRRAWLVAVVLFSAGGLAALLRGPDPVAVVATVGMVVALVWNRDAFRGRPDPGSLLDVARFVPRYLGVVLAFGLSRCCSSASTCASL